MPKFFTIKTKCVRAPPSLMNRSIAFTTGGSLVFVLQANYIPPKMQKKQQQQQNKQRNKPKKQNKDKNKTQKEAKAGLRYLHTKT